MYLYGIKQIEVNQIKFYYITLSIVTGLIVLYLILDTQVPCEAFQYNANAQ